MTDTTRPGPGQRGKSLDAEAVDELMNAVLELTADVAALRERVSIWERVLEAKGFPVTDGVESHEAAACDEQLIAAERDRLLRDVMKTLEMSGTRIQAGPARGRPARARVT